MEMPERMFADRTNAGRRLAERFPELDVRDPVILALGTDAVPVAVEVAKHSGGEAYVVFVEQVGPPMQPDLNLATVVDFGQPEVTVDRDGARAYGIPVDHVEAAASEAGVRLESRRHALLGAKLPPLLWGRSVVVVGDGLAPAPVVRAAVRRLCRQHARGVTVALPIAQRSLVAWLRDVADRVICLDTYDCLFDPKLYYASVPTVGTAAAARLLARCQSKGGVTSSAPDTKA